MPLEIIASQRGKPLLVKSGYVFYIHRQSDQKVIWRCVEYKKGCRGRCHTSSAEREGKFLEETAHDHAADASDVVARKTVMEAKQQASTSQGSSSKIVSTVLASVPSSAAGRVPSSRLLLRTVQRVRQIEGAAPPMPLSRSDLVLPDAYKATSEGSNFLLYDANGKNSILIFGTFENLAVLARCGVWFSDGTFRTVPTIFGQLYTIHGLVGSQVIPLVFMLLCDKKKATYIEALNELKRLEPALNPGTVMIDFEQAFLTAVSCCFPEAEVKGCFFHLSQCLWRHVQGAGLRRKYCSDCDFALHVKMFLALAFVPVKDVARYFGDLIECAYCVDNADAMEPIIEYMESTFIGVRTRRGTRREPRFGISLWNHYETVINDGPRTNNSAEAWHRAFSSRAESSHVSIWKFIELLKREQGLTKFALEQNVAGEAPPSKRRKYRDYDARLKNVVTEYSNREPLSYLRGIAHNLSL